MKSSQRKGVLVIVLATLVVLFFVASLSKTSELKSSLALDPLLQTKYQILAMVSTGNKLSVDDRNTIFQLLSGPKVLQYRFTPEEKAQIIKVLNK